MAQTDELGMRMVVGKTVRETEFDDAGGLVRIVLTFSDDSQLMVYGEGLGYASRQSKTEPLPTHEQLLALMRHQRES